MRPDVLASLVVEAIGTAVAPLHLKLAALEAQLAALETRTLPSILAVLDRQYEPGPPGPPGPTGADGKDGRDGKDGAPGLTFRGVFASGTAYAKGDLVTWKGSGWHCNDATTSKPGEHAGAWTLMIKGRDHL